MNNKLYSTEEIANILKLSIYTIRKKIRNNELQAYKVGKRYLIAEAEIQRFLNDLTKGN